MKKNNIKIKKYDSANCLPKEWDEFCRDNFFMSIEKLLFMEKVNNCNQEYYMICNEQKIEACFVIFPTSYEFSKKIKLNVKLIFLPLSVAEPGIIAISKCDNLKECLKKIKGIKLILSTNDNFDLVGGIKFEGLPNCVMNIKWDNMQDYMDNMRFKYRRQVKRAILKRKELSVRLLENQEDFNLDMYDLYMQVINHADYVLEVLKFDFFRNNFSKTIVLELENKPKAFVQFAEYNNKMIAEFCGFDYIDRDKYNLYENIIISLIEYAIDNKIDVIDIGQSAERTKLKFGAYLEKKYSWLFYNGNKIINWILKVILLSGRQERKIYKYQVFKSKGE